MPKPRQIQAKSSKRQARPSKRQAQPSKTSSVTKQKTGKTKQKTSKRQATYKQNTAALARVIAIPCAAELGSNSNSSNPKRNQKQQQ